MSLCQLMIIVDPLVYRLRLRPFIHGGKDQHKSCTAHHANRGCAPV